MPVFEGEIEFLSKRVCKLTINVEHMIRADKSVRMLKAIAMIASLAILLWSLGLPSLGLVKAAALTNVSDTLSDSAPGVVSDHSIEFTFPGTGLADTGVITIDFGAGFNTGSVAEADVDLLIDGSDVSDTLWNFTNVSATQVTLTLAGTSIGVASTTEIRIGTNAASGVNQITNPATDGSHTVNISTDGGDAAETRVAILDSVLVTATVDTIFTFSVGSTSAGTAINGQTSTGVSGTSTIPFGALSDGIATTVAQTLTVNTNAANGYVVTVQLDGYLESGAGERIYGFDENSDTNTPEAWNSAVGVVGTATSYGHWGVTSDDTDIDSRTGNQFADDLFIAASTTAREVMEHDGPVNGAGVGVGTTTVGYRVEINALQAAGEYTANLTYVATPTF